MCGIVGYIGQSEAKTYLLDGLESLEYRGYDSAGISTIDKSVLTTLRVVGRVEHLRASEQAKPVRGKIGIGHTRFFRRYKSYYGFQLRDNISDRNTGIIGAVGIAGGDFNGICPQFKRTRTAETVF